MTRLADTGIKLITYYSVIHSILYFVTVVGAIFINLDRYTAEKKKLKNIFAFRGE